MWSKRGQSDFGKEKSTQLRVLDFFIQSSINADISTLIRLIQQNILMYELIGECMMLRCRTKTQL